MKTLDLTACSWTSEQVEIAGRNRKAKAYSRACRRKIRKRNTEIKRMLLCSALFIGAILISCEPVMESKEEVTVIEATEKPETILRSGYLLNGVLHTDDGNIWIPLDPPEDNGTELLVDVVFDTCGTIEADDDYILYISER